MGLHGKRIVYTPLLHKCTERIYSCFQTQGKCVNVCASPYDWNEEMLVLCRSARKLKSVLCSILISKCCQRVILSPKGVCQVLKGYCKAKDVRGWSFDFNLYIYVDTYLISEGPTSGQQKMSPYPLVHITAKRRGMDWSFAHMAKSVLVLGGSSSWNPKNCHLKNMPCLQSKYCLKPKKKKRRRRFFICP